MHTRVNPGSWEHTNLLQTEKLWIPAFAGMTTWRAKIQGRWCRAPSPGRGQLVQLYSNSCTRILSMKISTSRVEMYKKYVLLVLKADLRAVSEQIQILMLSLKIRWVSKETSSDTTPFIFHLCSILFFSFFSPPLTD